MSATDDELMRLSVARIFFYCEVFDTHKKASIILASKNVSAALYLIAFIIGFVNIGIVLIK